ncbi:hypothetical protein GWI33_011762, partial [Rhynchophorus ferrugineus]
LSLFYFGRRVSLNTCAKLKSAALALGRVCELLRLDLLTEFGR